MLPRTKCITTWQVRCLYSYVSLCFMGFMMHKAYYVSEKGLKDFLVEIMIKFNFDQENSMLLWSYSSSHYMQTPQACTYM